MTYLMQTAISLIIRLRRFAPGEGRRTILVVIEVSCQVLLNHPSISQNASKWPNSQQLTEQRQEKAHANFYLDI